MMIRAANLGPVGLGSSKIWTQSLIRNFASKMQASSTSNTKDSRGKALGLKKHGDQYVYPGDIIVRQRGFKWHPKHNVTVGKDHTIAAAVEGIVKYEGKFFCLMTPSI
jgi:large subunit ribosomal protein L27